MGIMFSLGLAIAHKYDYNVNGAKISTNLQMREVFNL